MADSKLTVTIRIDGLQELKDQFERAKRAFQPRLMAIAKIALLDWLLCQPWNKDAVDWFMEDTSFSRN